MRNLPSRRRAFTLVELLTVIAIISLLIGILVPSLSRAREQAKNTRTRATMKAMGDGLELFKNENPGEVRGEGYPSSYAADDPTEDGEQLIFGAQWVVRYLMGKDFNGYVAKKNVPPDLVSAGVPLWEQRDWYELETTTYNKYAPLPRSGPYLDPTGVTVRAPVDFESDPPPGTDPKTLEAPVLLDSFDMPILYYAANTRLANKPNAAMASPYFYDSPAFANLNTPFRGVYTLSDNGLFTGACDESTCLTQPWDFGAGSEHGIKNYGMHDSQKGPTKDTIGDPANQKTFPFFIFNRNAFESSGNKSVIPVRRDSYIFIAAGKDQLYGTTDDVVNFER